MGADLFKMIHVFYISLLDFINVRIVEIIQGFWGITALVLFLQKGRKDVTVDEVAIGDYLLREGK